MAFTESDAQHGSAAVRGEHAACCVKEAAICAAHTTPVTASHSQSARQQGSRRERGAMHGERVEVRSSAQEVHRGGVQIYKRATAAEDGKR